MWDMLCKTHSDLKVTYDYYRTIFCEKFNIGFGAPYVDTCSTCSAIEKFINEHSDHRKVTSYVWLENEFAKGSNAIGSAVHHQLVHADLDGIPTIRLFSDRCGCQNKNTNMIGIVMYWFVCEAPGQKKIEIWFPIVGHSFTPPDWAFGIMGKTFRKLSVVENPTVYIDIIK
ncbi:hypothetical protein PR048_009109 [Dryococelus australis]|uniref:DUF7869 domain-containing protein n=1 Tax=Dryococelus australis TaxID=614101 RepID=A0ABQ9HZ11_9NEOP|nr:hypothetical protein PR048_009109 [Dryococelus australis]